MCVSRGEVVNTFYPWWNSSLLVLQIYKRAHAYTCLLLLHLIGSHQRRDV